MSTPNTEAMPRPGTGTHWKHVNGFTYEVCAIAKQDDKDEHEHVVLRGLHDGRTWLPTLEKFNGTHESGVARFTYVGARRTALDRLSPANENEFNFANRVFRNMCELPDYNSPADNPDCALSNCQDMHNVIGNTLEELDLEIVPRDRKTSDDDVLTAFVERFGAEIAAANFLLATYLRSRGNDAEFVAMVSVDGRGALLDKSRIGASWRTLGAFLDRIARMHGLAPEDVHEPRQVPDNAPSVLTEADLARIAGAMANVVMDLVIRPDLKATRKAVRKELRAAGLSTKQRGL